jgi:uncharacterized protein
LRRGVLLMASSDPSTWKLPRLRIDRDGDWFHEGEEVSHEGILASLRQGLQVDSAGHFLQIGSVRVPVEVEDAPFVVVRFETEGEGWALWLSDGSREVLDPASLVLRQGDVPYCRVKDGRFEARFSRAAAWQLLQRLDTPPGGTPTLAAGGRRYPLGA